MTSSQVKRFYSLDALRGIAALSVVFWHWQHFLYANHNIGSYPLQQQPLYSLFFLFYQRGWLAIDIFFSLSGFIFFWLYAEKIRHGTTSIREFIVLRVSRLYPLHLATLLLVALEQWWFAGQTGSAFIYVWNDAYHFMLNLLFAPSWGLEAGQSFNGPVWSVSVEIVLYTLFFLMCRSVGIRVPVLLMAVLLGIAIELQIYLPIGRGIGAFFLGALAYLAYARLALHRYRQSIAQTLILLALLGWLATLYMVGSGQGEIIAAKSPLLGKLLFRSAPVLLFPTTILALALTEHCRGSLGKRLSLLGDISYSSYLLHFPLQITFAGIAIVLGIDQKLFYSPWTLLLFFAVLLPLSLMCYRHFEMPLQRWLRQRLSPRRPN